MKSVKNEGASKVSNHPNESDISSNEAQGNTSDDSVLVSFGQSSPSSYNGNFGGNSDEDRLSSLSSDRQEHSSDDGNNGNEASSNEAKINKVSSSSANVVRSRTKNSRSSSDTTRKMPPNKKFARHQAAVDNAMASLLASCKEADAHEFSRKRGPDCINGDTIVTTESSSPPPSKKKAKMANNNKNNKNRSDRNAREKERSFRISQQIEDLRMILAIDGILLPKGTKSSILTEAANYIRHLQQHQAQSEIAREQLIQQMQLIGCGVHGAQAAATIRQVAALQGVWSLGNFGGVPPPPPHPVLQEAAALHKVAVGQPTIQIAEQATPPQNQQQQQEPPIALDAADYKSIYNSCGVAMAIASMSGEFIDCNSLFSQLSNYTKKEICSLTIFTLTAKQDLHRAFDQICMLISPSSNIFTQSQDDDNKKDKRILLRGAMKNHNSDDLGLCVSLVKDDNGSANCFCVTLIKNPSRLVDDDDARSPVHVSFDSIVATTSCSSNNQISKVPPDPDLQCSSATCTLTAG